MTLDHRMLDPETNDRQYDTEDRLTTRMSIWQPASDGSDPTTMAFDAVNAALPESGVVVEAGCGTGTFAERVVTARPDARYFATDRSARMVDLTAARGVDARVAEASGLPFDDDSADVVVANWMLYHVPDLDSALAEFRRVLRPGGTLVAVTNGDQHLADLLTQAGDGPLVTQFSTENGAESLPRHFDTVEQTDMRTRAVFPDHATAVAYLRTVSDQLADALPGFTGSWEVAGHTTVFTAERPTLHH